MERSTSDAFANDLLTLVLSNGLIFWALALGTTVLGWIAISLVKRISSRHISKIADETDNALDDFALEMVARTHPALAAVFALWLGSRWLVLGQAVEGFIRGAAVLALLLQVAIWALAAIDFWVGRYGRDGSKVDAEAATTVGALRFIGKLVVLSLLLLLALENLGVDVTALITGLGIGGIAVALAVQNILGDLFGSLSIVFDKPFVIGDTIIVGEYTGTVEQIGLKSTRLKSISGEQLIFANSDLLKSRIRNLQRRQDRRGNLSFQVVTETPVAKLEGIPEMVRRAVEAQNLTRFGRAHLTGFADSGLRFEAVYYMTVPDYDAFMDRQQAIHVELLKAFEEEGIGLSYPTRTLYLQAESDAPLSVSPRKRREKRVEPPPP